MESKKTTELRKRKGSIKAKLMAAVAMLLVSTIMLSSTTYAWFILSTAPEVTGMETTVGSNGALEIALLNNETGTGTASITSNVGESSANGDIIAANESWGNIVSLSDASYGLSNVTLYPAALNMADSTNFESRSSMLAVPVYGVDGRVAELSAEEVVDGKLNDDKVFENASNLYGVRAIGTSGDVDPVAMALSNAQSAYTRAYDAAAAAAGRALNGSANNGANAAALMKLILNQKIAEYGDKIPESFKGISVEITDNDKAALGTIITSLTESVNYVEAALMAYAAGYEASQGNIVQATAINLDDYEDLLGTPYLNALDDLRSDIADAQAAYTAAHGTNGTGGSGNYDAVLDIMVDLTKTRVVANDGTDKYLNQYGENDIGLLLGSPQIYVEDGLLSDVANFVNDFQSKPFSFATGMSGMSLTNGVMIATPNADVDPAYLVELRDNAADADPVGIMNMTTDEGASASGAAIATTYGYAIDLAFRSSVDTTLMLSDAVQRVSSSEESTTMGSGSNFTVNGESTEGLGALRIVFINENNQVVGVAALDAAATDGAYAVHMYDYTITVGENGTVLALGAQKATDEIISLTADVATKLSVLVYLDGESISSSMNGATGTLNLQFKSSETLTPMDYSGYVASVGTGD